MSTPEPTPSNTNIIIPTPTPTITSTFIHSIIPTPTLTTTKNIILNKIPLKDGIIEWSNKVWELPSSTPADHFIKIIDNTPSSFDSNFRLSFYKKTE